METALDQKQGISQAQLEEFRSAFHQLPNHKTSMNAIKKNGIQAVAVNEDSLVNLQYTFSNEIKTGEITNQKQSGRCWMFAGLNTLRTKVSEKCNLESFELSQSYQMFWDKFEKANYFLESILSTLDEETDSRLVAWLLAGPVQDGGQWDMFVNLVNRYGVVPKYVMPETFHSSQSSAMNRLLTVKLREDAAKLRADFAQGARNADSLRAQKQAMLQDIYSMLCHFLGEPPVEFDFEYRDKDDNFHRDAKLTPAQFYEKYVGVDLNQFISVINAPTKDKPFGKTYTVRYLGNVLGGKDILYLNVDIDELRGLALKQLEDDRLVWFGCDVGQMLEKDAGIMDTALYDYEAALGVPFHMTKAERLDYGESLMTHAMVFKGVNLVDGKPNRWKVENSWGTDRGNKGFFVMSDAWFSEFMYQIVIDKKYLPTHLQQALAQKPIELQPWDPMGSLAAVHSL